MSKTSKNTTDLNHHQILSASRALLDRYEALYKLCISLTDPNDKVFKKSYHKKNLRDWLLRNPLPKFPFSHNPSGRFDKLEAKDEYILSLIKES